MSEKKGRGKGTRHALEHDGFCYFCGSDYGGTLTYRCKGVRAADGTWSIQHSAEKRSRFAGATFCKGKMEGVANPDGSRNFQLIVPHVCRKAMEVEVEAEVATIQEVDVDSGPERETVIEGRRADSDPRPYLEMVSPSPDVTDDFLCLRNVLDQLLGFNGWRYLSGGGPGNRFYARQASLPKELLNAVERAMEPYVKWVQGKYPKLGYVRFGVLKTAPKGASQFEHHHGRLHSDYDDSVYQLPYDERPVSLIVALDPFELMYLPDYRKSYMHIETLHVRAFNGVCFTNRCLHSGGPNLTDKTALRLFAYMVSRECDFPSNEIWLHRDVPEGVPRGSPSEEHTAAMSSTSAPDARVYGSSRSGRVLVRTDRLSDYDA